MADATTLLDTVESAVAALYPGVQVNVSKRSAAGGRNPLGGYAPGYASTCFVVSAGESETIDDAQSFEHNTTRYWVLIEYVKPAEKAVPDRPGKPASVVEDSDIRDKREELRLRFNRYSLAGISNLMNVKVRTRPAYEVTGDDKTLVVSGEAFGFDLYTPRPTE